MEEDSPPDDRARIAHLLRRTTFGPVPGQVEELAPLGYATALDLVLGRGEEDSAFDPPMTEVPDVGEGNDEHQLLARWWIDQMRRPWSGLHEKMVWFWHGHFTSSVDKCSPQSLAMQHGLVRRHALGNFRQLAREIVIDGAMLSYLDADGSVGEDPNENLARELMEVFMIGHGEFSQADVREAAKALSGWHVDWKTGEVNFEPENNYRGAVKFLGHQGRFSPTEIVDLLCDHPACAPFVAGELHRFLMGTDPSPERANELGAVFRAANLEILPLVEAIVDHPDFEAAKRSRPRFSIEWFVAMTNVIGLGETENEHLWALDSLDQLPFAPPNVAGWAEGDPWLSPSLVLAKSNLLFDIANENDLAFRFDEDDPIPDALRHCSIYEPMPETLQALDDGYWAPFDVGDVNTLLVMLALASPDFALA